MTRTREENARDLQYEQTVNELEAAMRADLQQVLAKQRGELPASETVLYGLPKGSTERHEEVLLLTEATPARIAKAMKLASADGFHSFRVAKIDLRTPPDFKKVL